VAVVASRSQTSVHSRLGDVTVVRREEALHDDRWCLHLLMLALLLPRHELRRATMDDT
jgi:hypothetical protein